MVVAEIQSESVFIDKTTTKHGLAMTALLLNDVIFARNSIAGVSANENFKIPRKHTAFLINIYLN